VNEVGILFAFGQNRAGGWPFGTSSSGWPRCGTAGDREPFALQIEQQILIGPQTVALVQAAIPFVPARTRTPEPALFAEQLPAERSWYFSCEPT